MNAVQEFESEFARVVGARFAIACVNGTVTLEIALRALGVKPGDRVATTPLTHSATTIAILNVGAVPVYCDVDPETWLMAPTMNDGVEDLVEMPVSLYGMHQRNADARLIDDAAQTLRPHSGCAFTSYSFQSSKILALGEGGMLVTNSEALATAARNISSLGYDLSPDSPRISKDAIKDPRAIRHVRYPSMNARMNEITAREGYSALLDAPGLLYLRRESAKCYAEAVSGCSWITPQHIPDGWAHDMWSYAVALDTPERWEPLAQSIVKHGGTRPFAAWRLAYQEPAFRHLRPPARMRSVSLGGGMGSYTYGDEPACPVAESLQPRIMSFQTNSLSDAERNAEALALAIRDMS